jgi:hypothetical protein
MNARKTLLMIVGGMVFTALSLFTLHSVYAAMQANTPENAVALLVENGDLVAPASTPEPTNTATNTPRPPTNTPDPSTATPTPTIDPGAIELLRNRSFEDDDDTNGLADFWGLRNPSGERRLCDALLARTGICAFEFRGAGATEDSILQQRADITGITFVEDGRLVLQAHARAGGAPNFRLRIVVTYSDSSTQLAQTRFNTPSSTYQDILDPSTSLPLELILSNSNVAQIRVVVWSRNSTGRTYFDDFSLQYFPGN